MQRQQQPQSMQQQQYNQWEEEAESQRIKFTTSDLQCTLPSEVLMVRHDFDHHNQQYTTNAFLVRNCFSCLHDNNHGTSICSNCTNGGARQLSLWVIGVGVLGSNPQNPLVFWRACYCECNRAACNNYSGSGAKVNDLGFKIFLLYNTRSLTFFIIFNPNPIRSSIIYTHIICSILAVVYGLSKFWGSPLSHCPHHARRFLPSTVWK